MRRRWSSSIGRVPAPWALRWVIQQPGVTTGIPGARSTSQAEQNADAHIDTLAKKYLGKDKYPWARPGDVRVTYEIEPTSASGMS